ncbi:hypothetical protein SAMN05421770_102280 [Granulicella rosea]|uniref:Uncharacterized protein n=1 Tax=Granulicella rosea TaxID=474952 RepID=A0A239H8H4_9BACT|nr:hypothetical protein [Granulicella rosea]SNS77709.1 hypothetical protein SAMN05421770_102280 [Granulicella rosea]
MKFEEPALSHNAKRLFWIVVRIATDRGTESVSIRDQEVASRAGFPLKYLKDAQLELKTADLLTIRQGGTRATYELIPVDPSPI